MEAGELRLEYVTLGELKAWPRNPKSHDLPLIKNSINRFGFNDPMTVDERTGQLLEGHGRLEALESMKASGLEPPARVKVNENGDWMAPLLRGISFESDLEAEAYIIGHNRSTEMGGWSDELLAEIFSDFEESNENLDKLYGSIGFDIEQAREIVDLQALEGVDVVDRKRNVEERLETYNAGEIKQVVMYFKGADFDLIIPRLKNAREGLKCSNHTELLVALLDYWEKRQK